MDPECESVTSHRGSGTRTKAKQAQMGQQRLFRNWRALTPPPKGGRPLPPPTSPHARLPTVKQSIWIDGSASVFCSGRRPCPPRISGRLARSLGSAKSWRVRRRRRCRPRPTDESKANKQNAAIKRESIGYSFFHSILYHLCAPCPTRSAASALVGR